MTLIVRFHCMSIKHIYTHAHTTIHVYVYSQTLVRTHEFTNILFVCNSLRLCYLCYAPLEHRRWCVASTCDRQRRPRRVRVRRPRCSSCVAPRWYVIIPYVIISRNRNFFKIRTLFHNYIIIAVIMCTLDKPKASMSAAI